MHEIFFSAKMSDSEEGAFQSADEGEEEKLVAQAKKAKSPHRKGKTAKHVADSKVLHEGMSEDSKAIKHKPQPPKSMEKTPENSVENVKSNETKIATEKPDETEKNKEGVDETMGKVTTEEVTERVVESKPTVQSGDKSKDPKEDTVITSPETQSIKREEPPNEEKEHDIKDVMDRLADDDDDGDDDDDPNEEDKQKVSILYLSLQSMVNYCLD